MAIGSCFFEELQQSLKSARCFSIMPDSSVDRSVKDQELIYCTYLQNGKPVNQLIHIVALDHANSQGILDAILAGLLKVGVGEGDLKKRLVGFGCDGASVMLGVNNGVTARLQHLCPSLVPIWFPSCKTSSKRYAPSIHKHYTCSAKASWELEEISKAMEISILRTNADDDTFNALKLRLTNSFCEFVSRAFQESGDRVLKATSTLFDLSNWPEDTTTIWQHLAQLS
ncbi:hypothetical protein AAFF_G00147750 [Aldrovandia affinis]|uniref:DUF4371 domain-containing protein n=1 Tax=Aldrovandia affinis TaxID=143900 RepID=A0AAD7RPI9_9TELE|nr:hypothetical protein AAFF_G00147750 [Aldrovandia affinis]